MISKTNKFGIMLLTIIFFVGYELIAYGLFTITGRFEFFIAPILLSVAYYFVGCWVGEFIDWACNKLRQKKNLAKY